MYNAVVYNTISYLGATGLSILPPPGIVVRVPVDAFAAIDPRLTVRANA